MVRNSGASGGTRLTGRALALAAALTIGPLAAAHGQDAARAPDQPPATTSRQFAGEADKPIRIGVYTNLKPDCTSGPLPAIRLVKPPSHGAVTVRRGRLRMTNHATCLAVETPVYIAFYKSRPAFAGKDEMQLEVKDATGRVVGLYTVVVTVRAAEIHL